MAVGIQLDGEIYRNQLPEPTVDTASVVFPQRRCVFLDFLKDTILATPTSINVDDNLFNLQPYSACRG